MITKIASNPPPPVQPLTPRPGLFVWLLIGFMLWLAAIWMLWWKTRAG